MLKKIVLSLIPVLDLIFAPLIIPGTLIMKVLRRLGLHRFPLCRSVLRRIGIFPIRDHYYDPQFQFDNLRRPLDQPRPLLGINWNTDEQIALLQEMSCGHELTDLPLKQSHDLEYALGNYSYSSGDGELWYQIIRLKKPRQIIEIGSGHSTLMARKAVEANRQDNPDYNCIHTCIEPYEMPWLEKTGITIVRKKAEDLDLSFFSTLKENDILFIDSSHMIRPDGDVLFEFLELLPTLNPGVIVHIHDIFTPANYPSLWLKDEVRFWNEQYLLEAFLTHNNDWKILAGANYLIKNQFALFKKIAPSVTPTTEPGSFYIQKIR